MSRPKDPQEQAPQDKAAKRKAAMAVATSKAKSEARKRAIEAKKKLTPKPEPGAKRWTIVDRMNEVLAVKGWSMRHWSIVAGCAEESHVRRLIQSMEKTGRTYAGDLSTWARLASSAGVSLDYLVFGLGDPWGKTSGFLARPDPYPTRALMLSIAHMFGFASETIEGVAAIDGLPVDPGTEYWFTELLQRERLRRTQALVNQDSQ